MNGFDYADVIATRIGDVPDRCEDRARELFIEWSQENAPNQVELIKTRRISPWPYYAREWLLEEMGAQFREIDGTSEILLNSVVYSCDESGFHSKRSIGIRALQELCPDLPRVQVTGEYTSDHSEVLYGLIGRALHECQEIEFYLSHSFIFAVSEKRKNKSETIAKYVAKQQKQTLGRIIGTMQKSAEFTDEIKLGFQVFLDMRNQLVHGLCVNERYSLDTSWGQAELFAFLTLFLELCSAIKPISQSCFEATFALSREMLGMDMPESAWKPNQELLGLFASCFQFCKEK